MFAWIPFLANDLGGLVGGWFGKRLTDRGLSIDASRKWIIWIGALLVLVSMPAVYAESWQFALALIAIAMFGIQVKASSLFAVPADLFPARDVGTIWGLFGAVGSFGGMLFSSIAGWTIDNYSWEPLFVAVAGMHVVSAVLVNIFIPRIELLAADRAVND
jgi:ACS family hexuronate transporter-like MFS transporter